MPPRRDLTIGVGFEWTQGNLDEVIGATKTAITRLATAPAEFRGGGAEEITMSALNFERAITAQQREGVITAKQAGQERLRFQREILALAKQTEDVEAKAALEGIARRSQRQRKIEREDLTPRAPTDADEREMAKRAAAAKRAADAARVARERDVLSGAESNRDDLRRFFSGWESGASRGRKEAARAGVRDPIAGVQRQLAQAPLALPEVTETTRVERAYRQYLIDRRNEMEAAQRAARTFTQQIEDIRKRHRENAARAKAAAEEANRTQWYNEGRGQARMVATPAAGRAIGRNETLANSPFALDLLARAQTTKARLDDNVALTKAGVDPSKLSDTEARVQAAMNKRREADEQRALIATNMGKAEIKANVDKRVAEAKLNSAIKAEEREILKAATRAGELGGTRFQRLQSAMSPSAGKLPQDFQTVGQFFGQKAITTLGFGVSGMVLGGLTVGLGQAAKNAVELERTFVRLRGQLQTIGVGGELNNLREQIKGVSMETGTSAVEVAGLAERFIGLYRSVPNLAPQERLQKAMADTASATKLAAVTGMEIKDVMASAVPLTNSFGVSMEQVGNIVVEAGEKFGIPEDQMLDFLGKSATVANQAGANLRQLTIVGANMALALGKDMAASADVFNKMPALIEGNFAEINDIINSAGSEAVRSQAGIVREALHDGQQMQALIGVLRAASVTEAAGGLNDEQRQNLARKLANPREVEEGMAVIRASTRILMDLDDAQMLAANDNRKLEERFTDFQETTEGAFRRIRAAVEAFAESLFRSGIADGLLGITRLAQSALQIVGWLAERLGQLNNVLRIPGLDQGLVAFVGELAGALFLITRAYDFATGARKRHTESIVIDTGAEQVNITVKREGIVATEQEAAANTEAAAAFTRKAGVGTIASFRNARAAAVAGETGAVTGTGLMARIGGSFGALAGGGTSSLIPFVGSTGLATGTIATAGAIAVIGARQRVSAEVERAGNNLRDLMRRKSVTELRNISEAHSNFLEKLGSFITGNDTAEALRDQVIEEKNKAVGQTAMPGMRTMQALSVTGQLPALGKRLSDQGLEAVQAAINADPHLVKLAEEAGAHIDFVRNAEGKVTELIAGEQKTIVDDFGITRTEYGPETPVKGDYKVRLDREKFEAVVNKILEDAKTNKDEASERFGLSLKNLMSQQGNLIDLTSLVNEAVESGRFEDAVTAAGGVAPVVQARLGRISEMQSTGRILPGEQITMLREELARAKNKLYLAGDNKEDREAALNAIASAENNIDQILNNAVQQELSFSTKLAELGSPNPKARAYQLQLEALSRMTPEAQLNAMPQLLDSAIAAWQEGLANISDPAALRAAHAQGFQVPREIQSMQVQNKIRVDTAISPVMNAMAGWLGTSVDAAVKAVGDAVAIDGKSTVDAALDLLEKRKAVAIAALGRGSTAESDINNLEANAITAILGPGASQSLAGLSGYFGQTAANFTTFAVEASRAVGQSLRQWVIDQLKILIERAQATLADPNASAEDKAASQARLDWLNNALNQWENMADPQADAMVKQQQAQTRASREQESKLTSAQQHLRTAQNRGGDLQRAQDDYNDALRDVTDEQWLISQNAGDATQLAEKQRKLIEAGNNLDAVRDDLAKVANNWRRVYGRGDPFEENAADIADARIDIARALREGRTGDAERGKQALQEALFKNEDLNTQLVKAQMGVTAALVERDPVKAAQAALDQARIDEATARGPIAQAEALAARIRAEHAVADAVSGAAAAQSELLQAMANAAGNTVEAARLAMVEQQRVLDQLLAQGLDWESTPVRQARAQVATSTRAFLDADVQDQVDLINFMLEMNQITTEDAVARLRLQQQRYAKTDRAWRDLERTIQGLLKGGGGANGDELQYNLPTELGLPTLYEARRTVQSQNMGIGYQDNRNVVVAINVNGAQDPSATAAQVMAAFQAATGGPSIYTGGMIGVGT